MKLLFLLFLLMPVTTFSQTATSYLMSGNVKLISRDFKNAISDFTKAIDLDPKNSQAYFNRGVAKAGLEEHTGAIADYNKSLELDPKNQAAYYKRGLSKIEIKLHKEAVSDFDKAIIVSPKNIIDSFSNKDIYISRGIAKYHLLDIKSALTDFSNAISMYKNDGMAYCYRGLCKIDLQQQKEGCIDLRKAAELNFTQAAELIRENCK